MGEVVQDFVAWMEAVPALWAYFAVLVIAYGENVLPPIPGDMIVVFGGYLAGIGKLNLILVIGLSTLGGALGFMTMYAVGRRIGDAVTEPGRLRWVSQAQVERSRQWLDRWGYGLIAANRFLSGLRSVISLTVGMAHTPSGKTALYATLSAFVWTALIAYGGYAVGDNWRLILSYLRDYGRVVVALIVIVILAQFVRIYLKRKGRSASAND